MVRVFALAFLALYAPLEGGGVMRAARQIFIGQCATAKAPTARDYVQDGLVAMWDGIENAGWGVHDANATSWVDLSGNGHHAGFSMGHSGSGLNPSGQWLDNAYQYPIGSVSTAAFTANLGGVLTLQFCYSNMNKYSSYWALYDTYDDSVNFFFADSWGTTKYGWRSHNFFKGVSKSFIPQAGTVSHYFNDSIFGLRANGVAYEGNGAPSGNPTSKTWCIGGPYASNYFSGNMHNVRIYNRILNDSEFVHNCAIDKERFNLP